ncbi:hypothetical protein CBL_20774 [Carabus blaptoides fortunei]
MLTDQHKEQRMRSAGQFLERYRHDGDDLFSHIVTGDETWISYTNAESKQITDRSIKCLPKQNGLCSSDEESELPNNSVPNEVTIRKNKTPSESNLSDVDCNMPCSSAEVSQYQFIPWRNPQIFSTNDKFDDIDTTEMSKAQTVQEIEDPTYDHGNASLNLTKLDSYIIGDPEGCSTGEI